MVCVPGFQAITDAQLPPLAKAALSMLTNALSKVAEIRGSVSGLSGGGIH